MDGMLGQTPFATDPAYVEVRLEFVEILFSRYAEGQVEMYLI